MGLTHKFCRDCSTTRPVEEFYRNSRAPDGRQVYCKHCQRERVRRSRPRKAKRQVSLGPLVPKPHARGTRGSVDPRPSSVAEFRKRAAADEDRTRAAVAVLRAQTLEALGR